MNLVVVDVPICVHECVVARRSRKKAESMKWKQHRRRASRTILSVLRGRTSSAVVAVDEIIMQHVMERAR